MQTSFAPMGGNSGGQASAGGAMPQGSQSNGQNPQTPMERIQKEIDAEKMKASELVREIMALNGQIEDLDKQIQQLDEEIQMFAEQAKAHLESLESMVEKYGVAFSMGEPHSALAAAQKKGASPADIEKMKKSLDGHYACKEKEKQAREKREELCVVCDELVSRRNLKVKQLDDAEKHVNMLKAQIALQTRQSSLQNSQQSQSMQSDGGMSMGISGPGAGAFGGGFGGGNGGSGGGDGD